MGSDIAVIPKIFPIPDIIVNLFFSKRYALMECQHIQNTEMKLPGASPQASSATAAHSCLDAPDTCLSPRSARSRKRGIRIPGLSLYT